jgi:hypothetical protein
MRQARFLAPGRRRFMRFVPLLGAVLTGWGCQQPPYYFYSGYGAPPCVPVVPAPAPPVNGKPGEPPTEVIEGGTKSDDSAVRTTTVVGSETSPGVVASEPNGRPRSSWRPNPDPDDSPTTVSIEGAVSSSSAGGASVVR